MRTALLWMAIALPLGAVEESQTIERTLPAAKRLEVDNVFGGIHVSGYDGREIRLRARESVRADSAEKLQQARREVKLDISSSADTARFYVDGPFRCNCDGRSSHEGYKVSYDFEIQAPRETAVWLRTVTGGDIRVEGVYGDYDIKNVNGGIQFQDASGSGRVYTVNGKVNVVFRRNPAADSVFGALNGAVDLYFQPDLSADLRMKTFNGHFYTDFPLSALPARAMTTERREGKVVYKADRYTNARVGSGGPEIKLDGFNGDIRILKREN